MLLLLLLLSGGRSLPPKSQRLLMMPVAAGQGRDYAPVLQLRRVDVDVAQESETKAGQARASEQHVLWCVGFLGTHDAQRRRAPLIWAPGTGRHRETADPVEVLARQAPVACSQLMCVHGRLSVFAGNRARLPVPPYPPEEAIRP